jgi:hypothetical protein
MQLLMTERLDFGDMRFWVAENKDARQFVVYRSASGSLLCHGFTQLELCDNIECEHTRFIAEHYAARMALQQERNLSDDEIWLVPSWYFNPKKEIVTPVLDLFGKRRIKL